MRRHDPSQCVCPRVVSSSGFSFVFVLRRQVVQGNAPKNETIYTTLCCQTPPGRTSALLHPLRFKVVAAGAGGGTLFFPFLQRTAARALRGHGGGLQSSFRRTGEEFAFRSTGEVKTLMQASEHAETAELSLEAGEVLSGNELPDCRLGPTIGDWGLHRSHQLTSRRTFREHGLLCCVACNPSRLRVSDVDNPTRLFRIALTVIHLLFPRRTSDLSGFCWA